MTSFAATPMSWRACAAPAINPAVISELNRLATIAKRRPAPSGEVSLARLYVLTNEEIGRRDPVTSHEFLGKNLASLQPCSSLSGHAHASNVPVSVPMRALRRPTTLVYPAGRAGPVRSSANCRHGNEMGRGAPCAASAVGASSKAQKRVRIVTCGGK